jgi:hypothetical protein
VAAADQAEKPVAVTIRVAHAFVRAVSRLISTRELGVARSGDAARMSVFLPGGRARMALNAKDLSFTFEGACATSAR